MRFSPLALGGAWLIEADAAADARGSFARPWCRQAFAEAGIVITIEQASASFNPKAGTLRGLHFAWPPAREGKVIRCARGRVHDGCARGRVHDVLVDLRPRSPTFCAAASVVLEAERRNAVYVPPGVAHGFQSLVDDTELHYMMSQAYRPDLATGVRFDDPAFGLRWPLPVTHISEADRRRPDFEPDAHRRRYEADDAA